MHQKTPETNSSSLSLRQKTALPIIAASRTLTQAANDANINRTTLRRWMEDDRFREELTRFNEEAAELARCGLQELMLVSVGVLADAMENAAGHDVRVRAARTALSLGAQLSDLKKLRDEVDTLRDAMEIWHTHYSKL